MTRHPSVLAPFLAALGAIALLSLMDVFMKQAALAVGAFSAVLLRNLAGFALSAPVHAARRAPWPPPEIRRLHLLRGVVGSFTAITFFSALTLLPVAEAIALSFVSPLVALWLAAWLLKERIRPRAIAAAALGLAGVGVIAAGRIGAAPLTGEAALGIGLVIASALAYAWNMILQRRQAQRAGPLEIVTWQQGVVALVLLPAAPWLLEWPDTGALAAILVSALLALGGLMALAWAYARAEAQVLVPVEYSSFAWAALFGWVLLREPVSPTTIAGAALIIGACWLALPRRRHRGSTVVN